MKEKNGKAGNPLCHIVTVGTTPTTSGDDVVAALVQDIGPLGVGRVVVIATADSVENAKRLLAGLGAKGPRGKIREIASAQSLDDAFQAVGEEIETLRRAGVPSSDMILHYTAGTKVMSAGAVLAAMNNDVRSLRYLYSPGPRKTSVPVITPTGSVMAEKDFRLALELFRAMRFQAVTDLIAALDSEGLTAQQAENRAVLAELAEAYLDWDRFRVREFLKRYRSVEARLAKLPALWPFRVKPAVLESLEAIGAASECDGNYPAELLMDLLNNALRRLAERRPDDALIRLHRAAELFAQSCLQSDFGIRTDDLDIRKVPPRYRTAFEAERRIDDAMIKLGLRKSYELLEVLGHPAGKAYRDHERLQEVLDERRNLVLAHGTRPATLRLAVDFLREVQGLLALGIKDLKRRMAAQQFPWIDNADILAPLTKAKQPPRKKRAGQG